MMKILQEDSRQQLINKSKNGADYRGDKSKGRNRYARRTHSHISSSVKEYNQIDMNKLFKEDVMDFHLKVNGETDDYLVRLSFQGVIDKLKRQIESAGGKFDFRIVVKSLIDCFNHNDVLIFCSCLHGDTKIKLLDGTIATVKEMLSRFESGEQLYVYSVDENGDFKPGLVEKVWSTGLSSDFIRITLDNDETILTTPDHLYMTRAGEFIPASDLIPGQSLMPIYFNYKNGYELFKPNSTARGWKSVYKEVANYFKSDEIDEAKKRVPKDDNMAYEVAIHHKDFNKLNNTPENLQIMTAREHWDYHSSLTFDFLPKETQEKIRKSSSENIKKLNSNPTQNLIESRKRWQELGRLRNYDQDRRELQAEVFRKSKTEWWNNLSEEKLEEFKKKTSENSKRNWKAGACYTEKFKKAAKQRGIDMHSPERQKLITEGIRKRFQSMTPEERKEEMKQKNLKKILKNLLNILEARKPFTLENYREYKVKGTPNVTTYFSSIDEAVSYFKLNHKVKSVEKVVLDEQPVYDIKVKEFQNFLVDAGVILHNCPDFQYRIGYWASVHDLIVGDKETRPSDVTNPNDIWGPACKHICLVLQNMSWVYKVAAAINNYVNYMESHYKKAYAGIIYPALYGKEYEEPDKVKPGEEIGSDTGLLDIANKYGATRGQFKKGNTQGIRFAKSTGEPIPDEEEED